MSYTLVKVILHSPDMTGSEQVELLVDTGLTYSWVSDVVLERLNVQSLTSRKFKTIDGRLLERKIGSPNRIYE